MYIKSSLRFMNSTQLNQSLVDKISTYKQKSPISEQFSRDISFNNYQHLQQIKKQNKSPSSRQQEPSQLRNLNLTYNVKKSEAYDIIFNKISQSALSSSHKYQTKKLTQSLPLTSPQTKSLPKLK